MAPSTNIWIAASDNNKRLVEEFLACDPQLVNAHDENGYTPIHAAASYNHLELLRVLVEKYGGDPNITDADGDTPLFMTETVEAARCLVDELGADVSIRNISGLTAAEAIYDEGHFPLVAAYLADREPLQAKADVAHSLPLGTQVFISSGDDVTETLPPVDAHFRARVEELAQSTDFNSATTQQELKTLVTDAIREHFADNASQKNTKSK